MSNTIHIRPAQPEDAIFAAPLICEAMGYLVGTFTNGRDDAGQALFEHFFQETNTQYSYENCQIAEYGGKSAGMILTYDGKELQSLRQPFLDYLKMHFNTQFDAIEDETQEGELYIDCLAVLPDFRGKSIGSALIDAAIEKSKQLHLPATGLLVSVYNEKALNLYQKIGFAKKESKAFAGGEYFHMQFVNS